VLTDGTAGGKPVLRLSIYCALKMKFSSSFISNGLKTGVYYSPMKEIMKTVT
jgi:hypothetical protein